MNRQIKSAAAIVAALFLIYASFVRAQSGGEIERDVWRLKQIANQAEAHFNRGSAAVGENRRADARVEFDESIEAFIIFGAAVRESQKLPGCFDQLTETVYRHRDFRPAATAEHWETRNYVPNILATILIANDSHRYGFAHVRPAPQLLYDSVRVPGLTDLHSIARAYGTTVEYVRYLNPESSLEHDSARTVSNPCAAGSDKKFYLEDGCNRKK